MRKRAKIKFEAIYLPDDKRCRSKKGFNSEDEAFAYVIKHNCESCKRDFAKEPYRSFCAYEWMVKKYEEK